MSFLLDLLIYHLPWWLQISLIAIPVGIAFYLIGSIVGWDKVRPYIAPAIAILAALGLLSRAQQKGYAARQQQEKDALDKAKKQVEKNKADVEDLPDDKLDKEVDRWSKR